MKVDRPFGIAVAMAAVVVVIGLVLWVGANPDTVRADTSAPAAPANLELTLSWSSSGDGEGMKLSWTAPEGTITGYQILRQRSGCDTDLQVYVEDTGSVATTYTDADAVAGVTYVYRVKAINSGTVGAQSDSATLIYREHPLPSNGVPGSPKEPRYLEIWNTTSGINLTWVTLDSTGVTLDSTVTGYQILRRSPEQCETFQVHFEDTESTSTYWKDTDVETETVYEYRVAAMNDAGTGLPSDYKEIRRSPPPGPIFLYAGRSYAFANSGSIRITIAINYLETDHDPETVDYTLRGDATLKSDGSAADSCESDGLGEDIEVKEVDEQAEHFQARLRGLDCGVGTYTVTHVLYDRNDEHVATSSMTYKMIGLTTSGRAQVGETLTADVSSIRGVDDYANATFTYQWLANDGNSVSNIQGARSSTYTLADDDEGKTIKVQVWMTDYWAHTRLTSAPTEAVVPTNSAATGGPTISGTTTVGETITADTSGISDADGLTSVSYTYQWISNDGTADSDIQDATSSSYTLVSGDVGNTIKVKVSFTDDNGNEETLTSAATAEVEQATAQHSSGNSEATGSPRISGTAKVGQTLTADTSGIGDTDGLTSVSYRYQWVRNDGTTDADIQNATGASYTLVDADEGNTIKVKVSFEDDDGNDETLTSAATTAVIAANTSATGAPTISGTVQVDQTLTADTSGIGDADGLTNVSYSYQWSANDGSSDSDVQDATSSSYTLVSGDVGKTIKVKVAFTDDAQNQETRTSAATAAVAAAALTPLTASIHSEPAPHDGQAAFTFELRFSENLESFSYKTLRDHAFTVTGGEVVNARRLERPANVRWGISVRPSGNADVTVSLPATTDCDSQGAICTGDGRKLASALEVTVSVQNFAATGAPAITGTARVGETLTASTTGISDSNGLATAVFGYQWLAAGAEISSATGSGYTLVAADEGKAIKVRVSFTDDAGNAETLTSTATSAVAASAPTVIPDEAEEEQEQQQATPLTATIHDAPESHDGSSVFTFELRLSEEFGISYKTLRDHAFTVTGGEVIKARRLERGKNLRWEISVTPGGNGDITVVLPATTDCSVQGAICTEDGRKLSNRVEVTVPGPVINE